jgi:hypothetical protein
MAIEEAIDEVKITRAATARAYGKFSCKMSLRASGKRGHLFMSYMQPFDLFTFPDDVGQAVQGVAHYPVNSLYAGAHQCFHEDLSHLFCHLFFLTPPCKIRLGALIDPC